MVASALAGLPAGLLWWLLAPLPPVVKRADGLYRAGGEGNEAAIAADGWFAVITLLTGILVALVVYLRTRPGRVGPLLAVAAGGVVGAVVAWRTGVLLGPGALESTAKGLPVGTRFAGPLELSAIGVLLAWPMGAVITYFAVAAGAETADSATADAEPGAHDRDAAGQQVSPADGAAPSGPR